MESIGVGYNLYGDTNAHSIMVVDITFKEAINREVMEIAIKKSLEIHPNVKVKLTLENNKYYFVENTNEFALTKEDDVAIITDTNEYLFGVAVIDCILRIFVVHSLADGGSIFPFIKTSIMCYLDILGLESLERMINYRKKKYSDILKYKNPTDILLEFEKNTNETNDALKDNNPFHKGALKSADNEYIVTSFVLSNKKLLDMMKDNNCSKSVLIGHFISEAMEACYDISKNDENIVYSIVFDIRDALDIKLASHECFSLGQIIVPKHANSKEQILEEEKQFVSLKDNNVVLDNFYANSEILRMFEDENKSLNVKKKVYKHIAAAAYKNRDTFSVSCISFSNNKEVISDYVDKVCVYSKGNSIDMNVEVQQVADSECITITCVKEHAGTIDKLKERFVQYKLLKECENVEVVKVKIDL